MELRHLPPKVRELQERAARRAEDAAFLIEEYIGCGSSDALGAVAGVVAEVGERPPSFPEEVIERGADGAFDEQIEIGLHPARVDRSEPWQRAAAVAARAEVLDLLQWQPPDGYRQAVRNAALCRDPTEDYLRRIEERLAAIERELAKRQGGGGSGECLEFRKVLDHARIDPQHALPLARMILEGIVSMIYEQQSSNHKSKPTLQAMIKELLEGRSKSIFPKHITTYLHTVRYLGNLVTHNNRTADLNPADVEIALRVLLEVVAWYVLEYRPPQTRSAD
jgi:hypothetical protein